MRYWFKRDIESLESYVKSHGYQLYRCDCLAHFTPERVSIDFLKGYFVRTFDLNGDSMFEYIILRIGAFDERIGIKSMTYKVEHSGSDDIIVFGYSDGGVIVVTARSYEFHADGLIANWWGLESTRFP